MRNGSWAKRYMPIALLMLALVLAGCFAPTTGTGTIVVTAIPDDIGAKVFLNGEDTGQTTPATLSGVQAGTHTVTVEAEGYEPQSKSVVVRRNETVTVTFDFEDSGLELATVFGFVSQNKGGRNLPGVTVTAYEAGTDISVASTVTDASGEYVLNVPAGTYDIVADKAGHGQAKRQDLTVEANGMAKANLIAKPLRDPAKGAVAPTIRVFILEEDEDGKRVEVPFEPGAVIDPAVTTNARVKVDAKFDMYRIDVWIGHRDDESDWPSGILRDTLDFALGDLLPPLGFLFDAPGETELIVAAYDFQENWTEVRIPFVYEVGEPSVELLPVEKLDLIAFTYGHDLGLYRQQRAAAYEQLGIAADPDVYILDDGTPIYLDRLDKDVTMYVVVRWTEVIGAAGYEIERAFDRNGPWERIAKLGQFFNQPYLDFGPELAPGKPVYYRVRAVGPNDEKGPWSPPLWVIPLDRFEILLVEPADDATDVSLTPTLRWTHTDIGADRYEFNGFVSGVTGVPGGPAGHYAWIFEDIINKTEVVYNFDGTGEDLLPGKTYQWNIVDSEAFAFYRPNSTAVSFPWTGRGNYSGSANGEFVFTTTTSGD